MVVWLNEQLVKALGFATVHGNRQDQMDGGMV